MLLMVKFFLMLVEFNVFKVGCFVCCLRLLFEFLCWVSLKKVKTMLFILCEA